MGSRLPRYLCLTVLLLVLLCASKVQSGNRRVFNIRKYGAIADGKTNNYKAILNAWNSACQSDGGGLVLIPKGTYLTSTAEFIGPCKGPIVFYNQGVLMAPRYGSYWSNPDHWIAFRYIENLIIGGGGKFDGQGSTAWDHNNCRYNPKCKQLPISMRLDFVSKARVSHVDLTNSMNFHMVVFECNDIKLDHLRITAPENSPNTDGIHVAHSTGVRITNSVIGTGDDCISFGSGVRDVLVQGVHCGPGHGISIGSLGKGVNENDVSGILVSDCSFSGTQNGLRIKTWGSPSNPMSVYNITFEHITMNNVNNPILIDQNYCVTAHCPRESYSRIQIHDVKYRNIQGTSSSKVAVKFKCSKIKPCYNIELNGISLSHKGFDGPATSECSNVNGHAYGYEQPYSCLKNH